MTTSSPIGTPPAPHDHSANSAIAVAGNARSMGKCSSTSARPRDIYALFLGSFPCWRPSDDRAGVPQLTHGVAGPKASSNLPYAPANADSANAPSVAIAEHVMLELGIARVVPEDPTSVGHSRSR